MFLFYACTCLIAFGLVFLFPETSGREVPDSVYETENYSKQNKSIKTHQQQQD